MTRNPLGKSLWVFSFAAAFACTAAQSAEADSADEEFTKNPTWTAPLTAAVKADTLKWLEARKPDDAIRKQAESLWAGDKADAPGADLLPRVVKTCALADLQAREVIGLCAKPKQPGPLPKFGILTDDKTPGFERNNLRLWYARWLTHERLYDDSLAQLAGLEPADVVDPASLLFYQAAANQWLLHKEPGQKAISRLLEREKELPRRYARAAALMQSDLAALQVDSLDHIDRRMRDTGIRLDLGHAGKKVRGVEDGIIASLDKLIADEEQKAAAAAAAAGGAPGKGAKQSSSPAQDSARLKGTGPGVVAKKSTGILSNWGDLDAKQRQVVLQSIGKEYPSHYRDIIEQYFKRLAADDEQGK